MKRMKRILSIALLCMTLIYGQTAHSGDLLTGVTRLSCEALLCLSSGTRPTACHAALSYYFAIKKSTWPATFAARLKFLNKCPTGNPKLARAVAGRSAGGSTSRCPADCIRAGDRVPSLAETQ